MVIMPFLNVVGDMGYNCMRNESRVGNRISKSLKITVSSSSICVFLTLHDIHIKAMSGMRTYLLNLMTSNELQVLDMDGFYFYDFKYSLSICNCQLNLSLGIQPTFKTFFVMT